MYKFEFEECWDFDEAIKLIKKESEIAYLKNSIEHYIFVQHEWQVKVATKLFKQNSLRFGCYFMNWKIKKDF